MHEKLQYRDSYAMAAFVDAAKVLFFPQIWWEIQIIYPRQLDMIDWDHIRFWVYRK